MSPLRIAHRLYYLQGVTGSGKNEVYLNLVFDCLRSHQSVIFLVPEIAFNSSICKYFWQRFGEL